MIILALIFSFLAEISSAHGTTPLHALINPDTPFAHMKAAVDQGADLTLGDADGCTALNTLIHITLDLPFFCRAPLTITHDIVSAKKIVYLAIKGAPLLLPNCIPPIDTPCVERHRKNMERRIHESANFLKNLIHDDEALEIYGAYESYIQHSINDFMTNS